MIIYGRPAGISVMHLCFLLCYKTSRTPNPTKVCFWDEQVMFFLIRLSKKLFSIFRALAKSEARELWSNILFTDCRTKRSHLELPPSANFQLSTGPCSKLAENQLRTVWQLSGSCMKWTGCGFNCRFVLTPNLNSWWAAKLFMSDLHKNLSKHFIALNSK